MILIRNRAGLRITSLALCLFCISCTGIKRVKVEYYSAPMIENIPGKSLLVGQIINHSEQANAAQDVSIVIYDTIKSKGKFQETRRLNKEENPFKSPEEFNAFIQAVDQYDWKSFQGKTGGDLLVTGEIWFDVQDHSGYDSVWYVNKYGYRVPGKVWIDRVGYDYKLHIVVIDADSGKLLLDKNYEDKSTVEGMADEVAVLIEITEFNTLKLLDYIQGKKAVSRRYLMMK